MDGLASIAGRLRVRSVAVGAALIVSFSLGTVAGLSLPRPSAATTDGAVAAAVSTATPDYYSSPAYRAYLAGEHAALDAPDSSVVSDYFSSPAYRSFRAEEEAGATR